MVPREAVGRGPGERNEYTRAEYDIIDSHFDDLVGAAKREILDA
jgi:hypothetical protein